ncbi:MAG TPA: pitrilysin family protein [Syntrophales bacterium]|nr:pitrilysin family protein [Syntrophales bacterium]
MLRRRTCCALAFWRFLVLLITGAVAASVFAVDAPPGQDVLRATLDNGLRVVVVRSPLAPVATVITNYLVGSREAPAAFPGMAHAQEHMMFRGSPGLSADQLSDIIALMGGMFNAETQETVTQYFFTVPSEDLDLALHIEAIRMRDVLDGEQLWKQERGAIIQEVTRDLSDPEYVFYTKLVASMFKGTPYAHTPLGTVSSFNKTTGKMLKAFYDTWYVPNNAILVIVGDVVPEEVMALVKSHFGDIPARKLPERPAVRPGPVKHATYRLKTDQSYGLAIRSFRMPGYDSGDWPAMRILAEVLNSQRGSLFTLVVEGKALAAEFSLTTLPETGVGYVMAAFPAGADSAALARETRRILKEDLAKGYPAELVEAAKRSEMMRKALRKNSVFGLAAEWSQALAVEGRHSPDEGTAALARVTAEDVNRVARAYLDVDRSIEFILTPESSGRPVASRPRGTVESFAPKETRSVVLPEWANKALGRLSVPPSKLNPSVSMLPNGLKLIVQPEPSLDTICLYGHIRNQPDMETPKGKEGVDQVTGTLIDYGTLSMDRLTFQKALDDIGAWESAGTDFSLKVLPPHFDRGVGLLADHLLHPAFPEKDFVTVRKQIADSVAGELKSPDYLGKRAMLRGLYPKDDPLLREATPRSIRSLTLQDVQLYHGTVFRPDLTTIVVIGRTTPEAAQAIVARHFGAWNAEGPKPQTLLPPVPPNGPSSTAVPDRSMIQEDVTLVETLGLNRTHPDYYALELGNHVLGGAFYSTRLYQDLREKTGLVYSVSSSFGIGLTRSLYSVSFGCEPKNVPRARRIVVENLRRMQETAVPAAELNQAKAQVLREIPLSESSVDEIADWLLYCSKHDLPLDESIRAAHRTLALTPADVQGAFRKWLRPGDLVQVTRGPPPR